MITDFFKLAFSSLMHRKLRSWLTIIGIFIGIAAVVALISIGQGLQAAVSQQFQALGTDKITVQPGAKSFGAPGTSIGTSKLTDDDIKIIKRINEVDFVIGYIVSVAKVEYRDQIKYVLVSGLPTDKESLDLISEAQSYKIEQGRNLKQGDKDVAVIGYSLVHGKEFNKPINIGDRISVQGRDIRVIGSLEKIGNPYDDSSIIVPLETAKEILNMSNEYSALLVKVKDVEQVDKVAENIKQDLRKARDLKEGEEDFRVQTTQQLLNSFNTIFGIVTAVFVGIAAISLVVGGVGIMNTMYTSVLERTKEIGIMKAIGAKNRDIFLLFFIESGLLGLVGGVIGILFGVGIAKVVELIASQALGTIYLRVIFPLWLILGALVFGFVVGSISGTLPAIQASRMKPVDALRYE